MDPRQDPFRRALSLAAIAWLAVAALAVVSAAAPWLMYPGGGLTVLSELGATVWSAGLLWIAGCSFALLLRLSLRASQAVSETRAYRLWALASGTIAIGQFAWGGVLAAVVLGHSATPGRVWFVAPLLGWPMSLTPFGALCDYAQAGPGLTANLACWWASVALSAFFVPRWLLLAGRTRPDGPPVLTPSGRPYTSLARWQLGCVALGAIGLLLPWSGSGPRWAPDTGVDLLRMGTVEATFPAMYLALTAMAALGARALLTLFLPRWMTETPSNGPRIIQRRLWLPVFDFPGLCLWALSIGWTPTGFLPPGPLGRCAFLFAWMGFFLTSIVRLVPPPRMVLASEESPTPCEDPVREVWWRVARLRLLVLLLAGATVLLPWGQWGLPYGNAFNLRPASGVDHLLRRTWGTEYPGVFGIITSMIALALITVGELWAARLAGRAQWSSAQVFAGWGARIAMQAPALLLWWMGHSAHLPRLWERTYLGRTLNLALGGLCVLLTLAVTPFLLWRAMRGRSERERLVELSLAPPRRPTA